MVLPRKTCNIKKIETNKDAFPNKSCGTPYSRPPKRNTCERLELTPSIPTSDQINDHCGRKKKGQLAYDNETRKSASIRSLQFNDAFETKPVYTVKKAPPYESANTSSACNANKNDVSSVNHHYHALLFDVGDKKGQTTTSTTRTEERVSFDYRTGENQGSSMELTDAEHQSSKKRYRIRGAGSKKPFKGSVIAGAPKPNVGNCPLNFTEIARMSQERQKFFLTQDPRKTHCLVNPDALYTKSYSVKKEYETLTKMVKYGDNLCDEQTSQSEDSFICEIIDQENPLQLDFQGLDYKNTYERDEQELENQRIYRKVCRYMERRKVKNETAENVEAELHKQMISVPKCFEVEDRNSYLEATPSVESVRFGKLFRAADKPHNQARIKEEKQSRLDRYQNNYLKSKEKRENAEKERKEKEKLAQENLPTTLAVTNFNEANKKINDAIQRSFHKQTMLKRKEEEVRDFPHTIGETKKFKKQLKAKNRVRRDEAIVKKDFNLMLGKEKNYPEIDLDISSTISKQSDETIQSTQSSDDEDEIEVGKDGDEFKIRGFHFKLGDNLRGMFHQRELQQEKHRVRDCITRDQWLKELFPKKVTVKPDVYAGIQKPRDANDPNLVLFHADHGFHVSKPEVSPIKQYIQKKLGRHYDRALRKNLKLAKPRLPYSVKKFNFIQFRYGKDNEMDINEERRHDVQYTSTMEYIELRAQKREQEHLKLKKERLDLLGIPCTEIKKSRLQEICENSESSDSDWVPEHDSYQNSQVDLTDQRKSEEEEAEDQAPLTMRMRGNMPAPKFREPTLRYNRHRPRDYHRDRVDSQLFAQEVQHSTLPIMKKLPPEIKNYENVREKKRPYTKFLEARHHHDHWNPTDQRIVDVHYQPKIVKAKVTEIHKKAKVDCQKFSKAYPPCNKYVEMDLTIPNYHIDDMVQGHIEEKNRYVGKAQGERTENKCHAYDTHFHSRPIEEIEDLDFPGHKEYLDFLYEIRQAILDTQEVKSLNGDEKKLNTNRDELIKELQEDLKSIESCLSSMSSSECTNLTNDSGSFLLLEGKTKLPLDYVRKAVVPFEELQRSRFHTEVIDVDKEKKNPFRVLPFPGQKKEQIENNFAKDSFFTFNTRLQNGLRLRLEVPVEDVRKKLLGPGNTKYLGAVTTDIDENYINELKNSPAVKSCKFKTGAVFLKDALRMKFESMLIQGQIVRTKIYDHLNEQHWENMQKTKMLYEKLFAKWEKKEYEAAMDVVYQVKSYYDITDKLRNEFHEQERSLTQLTMDIVFLEGHWIRCIQLQNFHYLMADQDWRFEHDWIHRIVKDLSESNEESVDVPLLSTDENVRIDMESLDVSIAKRPFINIRDREKDDAWAIKAFYYNVYMENVHPILTVFPDYISFLKGVENLKAKTFVLLLEMHFTIAIHTELQGRFQTFQDWCTQDLLNKQEYVARKCAKKYFMEGRAKDMKQRALAFLEKPIQESFSEPKFIHDSSMILEVWRTVVPAHLRGTEQGKTCSDMVAMMMDVVLETIARFENIPVEKVKEVEEQIRKDRAYAFKISRQAYQIEKRIEAGMRKVKQNLEPVKKVARRKGKLPRVILKKKVVEVVEQTKPIAEHTKFFYRAFHEDDEMPQLEEARESLMVIDTMQEHIVPFFFDHFLKLNGYTPNYNFKTQVELRDGPELMRLQVQNVIPDVLTKTELWEATKKRIMEEHISRNPQMYENVK